MSAQGQIKDFLAQVGKDGEFVPMTPNQIALQTGVNRDTVNKTLYGLAAQGRVEVQRGDNGRDIVGVKVIDMAPRQRGGARTPRVRLPEPVVGESRRRVSVGTPALDDYAKGKARFEAMRADFGDLIEATFRENPYAEEGLRVRARLADMEAQLIDVRNERDELRRDYDALRAKKRAAMAEEAVKNGTVVVHGD